MDVAIDTSNLQQSVDASSACPSGLDPALLCLPSSPTQSPSSITESMIRSTYPVSFHRRAMINNAQNFPATVPEEVSSGVSAEGTEQTAEAEKAQALRDEEDKLRALVDVLKKNEIPGPQLFRLKNEFHVPLGFGGEGKVRGACHVVRTQMKNLNGGIKGKWPMHKIAIKNYGPKNKIQAQQTPDLGTFLKAAAAEVSTLSPNKFQHHDNIVQLKGWGLCLDTLEFSEDGCDSDTKKKALLEDDSCCFSLQLPLLVLERAECDFDQFLLFLFPQSKKAKDSHQQFRGVSQESLLELGFHHPANPFVPKKGNLCCPVCKVCSTESQHDKGNHSGHSVSNTYELVRQLCIDVGHGLQFLHENRLTHGDLKPQNVLIFQKTIAFTAKICDFGHSHSLGSEESDNKEPYNGTDAWRPWWFSSDSQNFETLRDYDLVVYGLLVWSAFCRAGHYLDVFRADFDFKRAYNGDVDELADKSRSRGIFSIPVAHVRLANRVRSVILKTVEEGHNIYKRGKKKELEQEPWEILHSTWEKRFHKSRNRSEGVKHNKSASRREEEQDLGPVTPVTPINSSIWSRRRSSVIQAPLSSKAKTYLPKILPPTIGLAGAQCGEMSTISTRDLKHTPQLLVESDLDIWKFLYGWLEDLAIKSEISQTTATLDTEKIEAIYHLARYRAKAFTLERWRAVFEHPKSSQQDTITRPPKSLQGKKYYLDFKQFVDGSNVLAKALEVVSPSPLDTCILAWLCKGDVGAEDVLRLPDSYDVWKIVLDRTLLDDSARLDRLLLLLQFGAHIERRIRINAGTKERSILAWFMRSYRPAKIPYVARKICERYMRAISDPATAKNFDSDTKYYMTGNPEFIVEERVKGGSRFLYTALLDFKADRKFYNRTAYDLLYATFDWMSKSTPQRHYRQPIRQIPFHAGSETTPLLTRYREDEYEEAKCPPGWKSHAKDGPYEESLTQSVTFRRPSFNPAYLSRIRIGYLGDGISNGEGSEIETGTTSAGTDGKTANMASHVVDVTGFLRHDMSWEEHKAFEARLERRFPYYDDGWFATEHEHESLTDDVLKELHDLWSITSFTKRVSSASAYVFNVFLGVLFTILLIPLLIPLLLLALL